MGETRKIRKSRKTRKRPTNRIEKIKMKIKLMTLQKKH
jgi:hypothetical protein